MGKWTKKLTMKRRRGIMRVRAKIKTKNDNKESQFSSVCVMQYHEEKSDQLSNCQTKYSQYKYYNTLSLHFQIEHK